MSMHSPKTQNENSHKNSVARRTIGHKKRNLKVCFGHHIKDHIKRVLVIDWVVFKARELGGKH